VTEIFSQVVNKNIHVPRGNEYGHPDFIRDAENAILPGFVPRSTPYTGPYIPAINPTSINKLMYVIPVKEMKAIVYQWVLPEQRPLWKTKPYRYLMHVMGHEGVGSLSYELKERGYVESISTTFNWGYLGECIFRLTVNINHKTAQKISSSSSDVLKEITSLVAGYIQVAKMGITEARWQEVEAIRRLDFDFDTQTKISEFVENISHSLQDHPFEQVLAAPKMMYEFDLKLIKNHFDLLTSRQLRMTIIGSDFADKCDKVEKWYGSRYGIQSIPAEVLLAFNNPSTRGLSMPKANPFIPTDLTLLSIQPSASPSPVLVTSNTVLFYKPNTTVPKTTCTFYIYLAESSLRQQTIGKIYTDTIQRALQPITYAAESALSKFSLSSENGRFIISVSGFSQKIEQVLKYVLEGMNTLEITKSRLVKRVHMLPKGSAYMHAMDLMNYVLYKDYYTCADRMEEMGRIESEDLVGGLDALLGWKRESLTLESFIEGNLTREDAIRLQTMVASGLGIKEGESNIRRVGVMKLKEDLKFFSKMDDNSKNGAVIVNVEAGWLSAGESNRQDLETVSYLAILSQILGQKFHDKIRTKQQLGYVIRASQHYHHRRAGMLFAVQSEIAIETVEKHILDFIDSIPEIVASMSDSDFDKYLSVVIGTFKAQGDAYTHHLTEIEQRRFDFDRSARAIPILITKDSLINFVVERIIEAPKLIAIVTGNDRFVEESQIENLKANPKNIWVYSNTDPFREPHK
jgi:insulysin